MELWAKIFVAIIVVFLGVYSFYKSRESERYARFICKLPRIVRVPLLILTFCSFFLIDVLGTPILGILTLYTAVAGLPFWTALIQIFCVIAAMIYAGKAKDVVLPHSS